MKLFTFLFTASVLFQNASALVTSIQLKTPFVVAACARDQIGNEGMRTESVTVNDRTENVSISVVNSLLVCADTNNNVSWKKVDPFRGFHVSYFNYQTNQLSEKTEVIKTSNIGDRVDLVIMDDGQKLAGISTMESTKSGSFATTVNLNKEKLFTSDELEQLNSNSEVVKVLELSANTRFTTLIDGEEFNQSIGDVYWSGRNLIVTFKKLDNQIKVTSAKL